MSDQTCIGCIHRKPIYIAVHHQDDDGELIEVEYTSEIEGYVCQNRASAEFNHYVDHGDSGCSLRQEVAQ